MQQPGSKNRYQASPASSEVVDIDALRRAAIEQAARGPEIVAMIDPNKERSHIESSPNRAGDMGASMVGAAGTTTTPETPVGDQEWWSNYKLLENYGDGSVYFRTAALAGPGMTREDFERAV